MWYTSFLSDWCHLMLLPWSFCRLQSQSPEVEQLGRVVELDSDMVDITQEPVSDSMLEESVPEDQEPVSASTHIASSLGINPHVLQVKS